MYISGRSFAFDKYFALDKICSLPRMNFLAQCCIFSDDGISLMTDQMHFPKRRVLLQTRSNNG